MERVLTASLVKGGEFAEVFAEDRYATGAVLDDGRVEELSSARDRGAGIRVVVGETTGFAHTADLSEAGLLAAAEAAAAVAREGGPGAPPRWSRVAAARRELQGSVEKGSEDRAVEAGGRGGPRAQQDRCDRSRLHTGTVGAAS